MAGFGQLAGLPEIVRDSQLPATFRWEGQQQFTIHTQGASRRAKQSQEVWAHMGTLGQGGFGSVELQAKQSKRTGQTKELRAVKSIRIPEDELNENREFYVRELEAIVKFSQARYGELFVKSYGWFVSQSVLHIAMEYCELGDLQRYLFKKCKDRRLPENQAHDIASQVLDALTRMHEEKFAHRDLKPANILIKSHPPTHPWVVKVADFGISRRDQGTTMNPTTSVRGTGSFMPPELLGFSGENSRAVDLYAVDMWCYGETLFRMLTGGGTFEKPADLYGYYFGHVKFPRAVLEEIQLSPAVIDFLQSLLTCDPAQRLTSETALDHSWMETDFQVPRMKTNQKLR
uniref:non-specific serine/threonine protein kinase n=1 Tax=Bionectria ochroleuca TaxID=29856 RepID=A0A0B7K400_BIOOC